MRDEKQVLTLHTKKGAQHPVSLLGFWREHFLTWKCYLDTVNT